MKTPFKTAVVTLGISLLVAAPQPAGAGGQGMPGNALNPGATRSVGQPDPDGMGMAEASRSPTGLLTIAPTLKSAPVTTSSGRRHRAMVDFGGSSLGGDDNGAKCRKYKGLQSGVYANSFAVLIEQPKSAFHFDAIGGGVARDDQFYGVDVGKYYTWRVRGSFSEVLHVFTATH